MEMGCHVMFMKGFGYENNEVYDVTRISKKIDSPDLIHLNQGQASK